MTAPRVVILDYGFGNLRSAERAFSNCGAQVTVTSNVNVAARSERLVVPGVGAFAACMRGLQQLGAVPMIRDRVQSGLPVFGICVGQQILFTTGLEHGSTTNGCGVLPGVVEKLRSERLPHIGWNQISAPPDLAMLTGVREERFYFVHSYAVRTEVPGARVAWTSYGSERFVAAVTAGPIWATQFHPEKSGTAGQRLIRNWLTHERFGAVVA